MRPICGAWLAAALLLAVARGLADAPSPALDAEEEDEEVIVYGAAPDGREATGAALAGVAALVLRAAGVRAAARAPPAACRAPAAAAAAAADPDACVLAVLRALSAGRAHAALLPVRAAGAPTAPRLRDAGLEDAGDAAPAWRRACAASRPPARSLLDLADAAAAARYALPAAALTAAGYQCSTGDCEFVPERCVGNETACATLLTGDESERDVLAAVVREHELHARVVPLGAQLRRVAAALGAHALVACDRGDAPPGWRALGPPPCRGAEPCPFEAQRLVKLVNVRALARHPSALRLLVRLRLSAPELAALSARAAAAGAPAAAAEYVRAHPAATAPGEARVAVLLPASGAREAYDAAALARAAVLAEQDAAAERGARDARFKVEVFDDGCSAPRAYKYLTDALGTGEYGALSALAGPACGAAFADVARQSPAHALPVLAYTPQPPPPPPAAALALLAAGEARALAAPLAALAARLGWRRLALLSEGARGAAALPLLQAFDVTHSELPDDSAGVDYDLVEQWAARTLLADLRVVVLSVEDARAARAALCAAAAAGAGPAAGAAWLLPGALPAGWLRGAARCDVRAAAAGHLRAVPAWRAAWRPSAAAPCAACAPDAALLYDALRLWAAALRRLLAARPAALDDLHRPDLVRKLIDDATSTEYVGLTGPFEWTVTEDGAHARTSPVVIQQWQNGTYVDVGRWERGELTLEEGALRWATGDGRAPTDGGRCALQPLADALGGDCRAAVVAVAALLLAALAAALAALALHCRRRAEREYRARLEALKLRTLGAKPGGLDRWELPRERVVINRKLGTGAFGTVYGGHALLAEDRGWSAVAVKTLKAGATTEEKLDFLSEAEAMKRFDHKNVVRLLGVVTKTEPVCTVMEFMLYGDLKNYLLARRHLALEGAAGAEEVSPRRLTAVALDVARGLSYLAQLRYVHRDVAARNCLVSAHRVVKLADFGMTRLVFENDYYRFSRKGLLPVRWMAPESLALGVFSPASDVWSFGVLLYEIVTFGSLPFQGLSNSEVLTRVKAGQTLELPSGLKPQLEGLIKSCWRQAARARPAAAEVASFLADAPRLLAPCLDVPLDALALGDDARDRAEARWVSWAAPASAATDTTYLSDAPHETDAFLVDDRA